MRVLAYAGTGKTSTLVEWAKSRPRLRILYLAFNKSVQEEASRRFPGHVTARTSHALAFAAVGGAYAHKLGNVLPYHLERAMRFNWVAPRVRRYYVRLVLVTLMAYWSYQEDEISPTMVPLPPKDRLGMFSAISADHIARDAQRAWQRMKDLSDPEIKMSHDGYLKLYALSRPKLPYDAILFDEAQDANPITLQLVLNQNHAQIVFVGDPWQAIYGFRGAVNAMTGIVADRTHRLTGSFRFGENIGRVATQLLRWRRMSVPPLRGLARDPGMVRASATGVIPEAVITRTNAGLFEEAVRALSAYPQAHLGFVGGIGGHQFDQLESVYRLWARQPVPDPFIGLFPSFDHLAAYADEVGDAQITLRCRLVKQYGNHLPHWLKRIQAASVPSGSAPIVLSTTHKAKGLEFDTVRVGGDFLDLAEDRRRWIEWKSAPPGAGKAQLAKQLAPQQELNLLYVAVTRARKQLVLPPATARILFPARSQRTQPPKPVAARAIPGPLSEPVKAPSPPAADPQHTAMPGPEAAFVHCPQAASQSAIAPRYLGVCQACEHHGGVQNGAVKCQWAKNPVPIIHLGFHT